MATIEILCRMDPAKKTPVVFLRDSINNDQIQVWDGSGKPQYMPLDYYKMTSPLSADDERVLAARYKQAVGRDDALVHINHRMPRTSRPVPNVLAPANKGPVVNAQGENTQRAANAPRKATVNAKPLDAQPLPQGPTGDLPEAGEQPAPLPVATPAATLPVANEAPSAALFRRIQELNQHSQQLNQTIANLHEQLANATTDCEATKQAIAELKVEFEKALDVEAAEELKRRKEMLAAITGGDALQTAAQALHDAGTQQVDASPSPAPETPPAAPAKASNSKPAAKGPAKGAASKTAAAKTTPASTKKK